VQLPIYRNYNGTQLSVDWAFVAGADRAVLSLAVNWRASLTRRKTMKFASYRTPKGAGYGVVRDDGVVDLTRRTARNIRTCVPCSRAARWRKRENRERREEDRSPDLQSDLPSSHSKPGKDRPASALNDEEHRAETGGDKTRKPRPLFPRRGVQVGHRAADRHAAGIHVHLDYEGEIAVIIASPGGESTGNS